MKEHASLGGTYEGVEPMGLIWSCKPVPEVANLHPRIKKADSRKPFSYTFQLLNREKPGEENVLASEIVERRYLADHVERYEASTGKAIGTWFLPKQKGKFPPPPHYFTCLWEEGLLGETGEPKYIYTILEKNSLW